MKNVALCLINENNLLLDDKEKLKESILLKNQDVMASHASPNNFLIKESFLEDLNFSFLSGKFDEI